MDILDINNIADNNMQCKDFIIKNKNENYSLKIKLNKEYILFIVKKINNLLDFYFQKKIKKQEIINKLKLTDINNINNELILNQLNLLNQEKKIEIHEIDDDNINIKIDDDNIKFEIVLFKKDMTIDDKFNILYNELKLKQIKKNYQNYTIDNQNNFEFIKQKKCENNCNYKDILKNEFYKKLKQLFEEQKKMYDNMIKELNEIKYIFTEKNNNKEINICENNICKNSNKYKNKVNVQSYKI